MPSSSRDDLGGGQVVVAGDRELRARARRRGAPPRASRRVGSSSSPARPRPTVGDEVGGVAARDPAALDRLVDDLLQPRAGDHDQVERVDVGRVVRATRCGCLPRDEQLEQRLLRVPAVLGLVPDALALAVEHRRGDLLARVRGQAVQRERARRGAVEQRVVDPVGGERGAALAAVASSSPIETQTSV